MKIIVPILMAAFLAACATAQGPSNLGKPGMPEPGNHWPNMHGF